MHRGRPVSTVAVHDPTCVRFKLRLHTVGPHPLRVWSDLRVSSKERGTGSFPHTIGQSNQPASTSHSREQSGRMHGVNAVKGTTHLFNLLALLPIPRSSTL